MNPIRSSNNFPPSKNIPVCLSGLHKDRVKRHFIRVCQESALDEHKELFRRLSEDCFRTEQFTGLCSRSKIMKWRSKNKFRSAGKTARQLASEIRPSLFPSITVKLCIGTSSWTALGRAGDRIDESISSPKLVKKAVLNGIGKLAEIDRISVQVALRNSSSAETFPLSRTWTPPRVVLKLSTGPFVLVNATFPVSKADLSGQELLIRLPVLHHLGVDINNLLEHRRAV